MGIFGGTKTYVASTLYNLAGDEAYKTDFLKTAVVGNVVTNSKFSIGDTLQSAYKKGPGLKMRSFFRWAEDNYDLVGVPTGNLGAFLDGDYTVVAGEIPLAPGQTADVQHVEAGRADYSWWAEQWMWEHHPDLADTDWSSDIGETSNLITITFEDTTTASFTPTGFDKNGQYLHIIYNITGDDGLAYYLYKLGSGNTVLDGFVADENADGEYMPFIPVRIDNKFLSDTYEPEVYDIAKKAFKKASGGKLDEVIKTINESEHLEDIDYAYVMYGVPLNTKENAAKKYLYEFFKRCLESTLPGGAEYDGYSSAMSTYATELAAWQTWKIAQATPTDPLYGTPAPTVSSQPTAPGNYVQMKSNGTASIDMNVDIRISWLSISETTGTGEGFAGAKRDKLKIDLLPLPAAEDKKIYAYAKVFGSLKVDNSCFEIVWQVDENNWKKLTIIGAVHSNYIYNGKAAFVTAKDAMEDAEDSGFLVPLHYATIREMRLVDSTQMSTSCTFLVLNSYVVKKTGFLSGLFAIFTFIFALALSIVFPPLGGALLGAFGTIGAAIGLTGFIGLLVGGIIFSLVTQLVMRIITEISIAIFGEKVGAIIGAIVSFAVMTAGVGFLNGQNLAALWGNMMSATGLLTLSYAVGDGVAGYVRAATDGIYQQIDDITKSYNSESRNISELFAENLGYGTGMINPLGLTEVGFSNSFETPTHFLSRTLMTGTDIAQLSMDMLTNFGKYTLSVDLFATE